ncbi:glycosyltransferase family 4 protein [Fictibacillus sp. B-59209]|uniref:glycosyltransferase family 4 protein n=1 Tax=Fictibacillus sp. B-59209 TaxID=3024873 RepID=UPI002E222DB5|nr:glycosyltransferase family 4 protein [Fictibacillus sp. B-59209]
MKKVLFVATVVKAHIMVFHIPFLKWFKENGYETYVCAKNDYENKEDCVIPYCDYYFDLPFERSPIKLNNFKTYKQLKEITESNEFDIIHCHTPMGGVLTRLAARNARKKNTNVIYTAHGFHFYKGAPIANWLLYYPVERWLSRHTDVLITINKEDFSRAQKFKAKSIEYVPGVGIDTNKFKEILVNKTKKRSEIGIDDNSLIVLSVGELNKNKNHETIIRSIAQLDKPDIYYVICGEGPLVNYLKNLTMELGMENQVKLLGFRTDIAELSKVSDIFAFPSFREGLSLSLMEAMTSGLPVVCSNIRGNSDLVVDGKGGYLVNPDNIQGFANVLLNLYESNTQRESMGIYNRSLIKNFDLKNVIVEMGYIYSKNKFH